ncbi:MAG: thiazole synthase, partial [Shinella sp.]
MLKLYDIEVQSRLLLGTARYPSPAILAESVRRSKTEIVTVSLRRETSGGKASGAFFELIRELGVRVLPNTAGCHSVQEAVLTAKMAREVFRTDWIKLEVIG